MIRAKILLVLWASFTVQSTAWAEPQSIQLKAHGAEVVFADPEQGSWRSVYYSKDDSSHELFPDQHAYFDESIPSDLSENDKYLKIHRIIRGSIEGEALEEDYERAYCAFVEMATGCVVRQETGSFCGGQWADKGDLWLWAGEEITIDQRDPYKPLNNSNVEVLLEINGEANLPLCRQIVPGRNID